MDRIDHQTHILSLLQKYIENRCEEHELNLLLHWLKAPDNLEDFNLISSSLWNKLGEKYTYPNDKRISELNNEVEALLTKIKTEQATSKKQNSISKKFFYRSAAVLLLLISLSLGYLWLNTTKITDDITYTEISAIRGEIKEYTLEDGTHIVLNSESKIKIPSDYNKENRHVEMIGEGFFNVTSNPEKPFIIMSGQTQVKVLGTSFNVKAYSEDKVIGITVSTGKVLVSIPDIDLQLRVLPMEHLLVNKETSNVNKHTLVENNYTKWIEGVLFFDKEPLSEVIKTISRKYERNVLLRCKNCNPLISGRHDNKSLEAVIDAICFTTGLKQKEEEGGSIILYE
ncbi:FecR family protein [Massilibacteroides vaginae]|uniref:FecR family protein n=1 Tax=Massilibacteroides vaginae TaxID=1673718 RepID=UPI000A1CDE15|nr:FecR domain-containing protein [Massilibacteroides vaginae]